MSVYIIPRKVRSRNRPTSFGAPYYKSKLERYFCQLITSLSVFISFVFVLKVRQGPQIWVLSV